MYCAGLDDKEVSFLVNSCNKNIYKLENEVNRLGIFDKDEQKEILNEAKFSQDTGYVTFSPFDLCGAIVSKDLMKVGTCLYYRKFCDFDSVHLVSILLNQFKNMLYLGFNSGVTAEQLKISSGRAYYIKQDARKYTQEQIKNVINKLTYFDQQLKSGLMDECRSLGILTLGPDVNESRMKFTVNKKGEIRFGLAAIKGMGEGPSMAIISEREKSGAFKDIYDFVERIDLRSVNRKAFESLALSGAFDSFGILREQFFATNAKGEMFIDLILKYGSLYQHEKESATTSLFGGFDDVEIAHPQIPKAERWPTIDRLNKERALVGVYLSEHPLDEYSIVLTNLCNTKCQEINRDSDKEQLSKKETITFGGIVTNVVEKFSQKTGKPFGLG